VLEALAQDRQHLAELQHAAEFRLVARVAVGRVIAVLLSPARVAPVAWMWPLGSGQIQTSVHPGGSASAFSRFRTWRSVIRLPSGRSKPAAADAPAPDAADAVRE